MSAPGPFSNMLTFVTEGCSPVPALASAAVPTLMGDGGNSSLSSSSSSSSSLDQVGEEYLDDKRSIAHSRHTLIAHSHI
jgi:hypothetical protein